MLVVLASNPRPGYRQESFKPYVSFIDFHHEPTLLTELVAYWSDESDYSEGAYPPPFSKERVTLHRGMDTHQVVGVTVWQIHEVLCRGLGAIEILN